MKKKNRSYSDTSRENTPKPLSRATDSRNSAEIETRDAFIANISHEIRTPMNAIMGFAQMLKGTDLDEKQSDYVDVILDSGQKLLVMINNLLDLSSLKMGKMYLNPKICNPQEIIGRLKNHFRPLIVAKNLKSVWKCDENLPGVEVDNEKLERVLSFILSNAIKFTNVGSITLRCYLQPIKADTALLHFEVEDTGVGIEPEQLSRIFDVFEQADNSITRPYPGLGLGLGLAQQIVKLLGGEIYARSTLGEGSCFHLMIPVKPL